VLIGLVGFRCCGKSTLRDFLCDQGYAVFDTNSVKTGDRDANQISLDEVLSRYGKGTSYLLFVERALRCFVESHRGVLFIDSLKVGKDADVLREMFPEYPLEIWYLHASFCTRSGRYLVRDVKSNIRHQPLEDHDAALEGRGIWHLIKSATEVINMESELAVVQGRAREAISRLLQRHELIR